MNRPLLSLPSPRPSSAAGTRTLRERHAALARRIDLRTTNDAGGAARMLVSIVDNGNMPTANDHYFAANPVELGGRETEGGSGSPYIDTTQIVLVDVIGSTVPSVGDLLVATGVGGRWVAERGSGAATHGCCQAPCLPCAIPQKTLTLNYTNTLIGDGSVPLIVEVNLNVANATLPTPPDINPDFILTVGLQCVGSKIILTAILASGPTLNFSCQFSSFSSVSCNPFSITLDHDTINATCPALSESLAGQLGYTSFSLTDPDPAPDPPGLMCQSVCVSCCGTGKAGIDVAISSAPGGQVASGTTGANGCVWLSWPGSRGPYILTATGLTGYLGNSYTVASTLECGGQTNIGLPSGYCCEESTGDLTGTFAYTWVAELDPGVPQHCQTTFNMSFDPSTKTWIGGLTPNDCTGPTAFFYFVFDGCTATLFDVFNNFAASSQITDAAECGPLDATFSIDGGGSDGTQGISIFGTLALTQ